MVPIYIATKYIQKRKHRKKRINKKWQKRYGYYEINYMPHNEVITMDDGTVLMTKRTFEKLKSNWIDIPLIKKEE
jgi:hypothetical protein